MRTDEELRERVDGAKAYKARSNGHAEQGEPKPELPPLKVRNMADLQGRTPKPREWLVPEWIPAGYLTGLFGKGGGGKTTISMQLGAESSRPGGHWLGMPVRKAKPLGVFCEDDDDEIERRLYWIAQGYSQPLSAYQDFDWCGRYGEDNLLVTRTRQGLATTTFYDQLAQQIADTKRDLVMIDGIVEVCGININDPAEVSWTLGRIVALGRHTKATFVLLGHPNKAGTSEFSGCATWENKPRARLYLGPAKEDPNEENDPNDPRRMLSRSKANMSGKDQMDLVWRDGLFRAADPKLMSMAEKCEQSAREGKAAEAFLDGIDKALAVGVTLSPNSRAGNYAPKELVTRKWADGFSPKLLAEAMNRLLSDGRIIYGRVGKSANRNAVQSLQRVA